MTAPVHVVVVQLAKIIITDNIRYQFKPAKPKDATKGRDAFNRKPPPDELMDVSDIRKSVTTSLPENAVIRGYWFESRNEGDLVGQMGGKLRGKSIWEIFVDQEDSWGWKNLLCIRDQIKDRVIYKIGNGRHVSMWFDNWSEIGPLSQHITYRDLYDERLDNGLKVSDMVDNVGWKWPNDWYEKFPMITSLNVPNITAGIDDKLVWKNNNGMIIEFSVSSVYHDLRRQNPIVPWWKLIWIFKDVMKSNEEVFKGIVEVIKYKLLGITMKDSKAVRPYNDIFLVSWSSLEVTVPISVL
ncbi:hypothetical protein Tco_0663882 [Tanacetum coccineum]